MSTFLNTPHHMNATPQDLEGNAGIGRYILLPGSDGRAKLIASHFENMTVKTHARGHHLYLGTLNDQGKTIKVAAIASGMGCPSMEIILHELFALGAKRFLRVGTAGSLQQDRIRIGDLINTQASVRDESTTSDYAPLSVPAIASIEMIDAIHRAALKLGLKERLHTGVVHCKGSFYAREFSAGPNKAANNTYMQLLIDNGVLATEMETAALFIQTQLYHHQMKQKGHGPAFAVFSGALLGIGAIPPEQFMSEDEEARLTDDMIKVTLEAIKLLAATDLC